MNGRNLIRVTKSPRPKPALPASAPPKLATQRLLMRAILPRTKTEIAVEIETGIEAETVIGTANVAAVKIGVAAVNAVRAASVPTTNRERHDKESRPAKIPATKGQPEDDPAANDQENQNPAEQSRLAGKLRPTDEVTTIAIDSVAVADARTVVAETASAVPLKTRRSTRRPSTRQHLKPPGAMVSNR